MHENAQVIRLLGGPPGLADITIDLTTDPRAAADATPERFVRVTRDSVVSSFTALQGRCRDRATAEQLAAGWRLVVFTRAGRRRGRVGRYRYAGTHPLVAVRDDDGRWTLAAGSPPTLPAAPNRGDHPAGAAWDALEAELDRAALRFATVASLLPDGPLAERALGTRREVGAHVADATRLCAVGVALDPGAPEIPALVERIEQLLVDIRDATSHLVALHLDVGTGADPVTPIASLSAAWGELDGGRPR